MAYTGIYATLAEVGYKAGLTASATSVAEAYVNSYMLQAEGFINAATKKVWATTTGTFAALPATVRGILTEAASNLAAVYAIEYDMSGAVMTTLERIDSEDKVNILLARATQCIAFLIDESVKDFLDGA